MDKLYKYKDTFSLRDEIGTCPNIEIDENRNRNRLKDITKEMSAL